MRTTTRRKLLFSYVVDHDCGFAPNPFDGICTLVHCKFQGRSTRRNIVELAEVGDWILGTGGKSHESAGNNKIIYLMRIDKKIPFHSYLENPKYKNREDCQDFGDKNQFALISNTYFYFGRNAIETSKIPLSLPLRNLVKIGPRYRKDLPEIEMKKITNWFMHTFEIGMHGDPCTSNENSLKPRKRLTCRIIARQKPRQCHLRNRFLQLHLLKC